MTYNSPKARALNQVALGIRPRLKEWREFLKAEMDKSMLPPLAYDQRGFFGKSRSLRPSETITLRWQDVESLYEFLQQAEDKLAKHSETIERL